MTHKDNRPEETAELRRRAEEIARGKAATSSECPEAQWPEEARKLLHELRVHQIELEMQNDELRRMQAELDVTRARYFDLYDLAPVGYITVSEKGLILEANHTLMSLLGVTKSAFIKRPLTRFILPVDQDIWYHHRRDLFETQTPQACQLRLLRKDGTSFWVQLTASRVQVNESEAPSAHVVLTDITNQKRIEEALLKTIAVSAEGELKRRAIKKELQRAHDKLEERVIERTAELNMAMTALKDDEERFRTVADFTIDWESWIGPDGRYIYVSPSSRSITGYLPGDFYDDPSLLEKIIHPEDLPAWNSAVTQDLQEKGETTVDFRIAPPGGGAERWISYKAQTVYNREGAWLGRRDSGRDITDRKRAENELLESQERFRSLVESTNDWVWEVDPTGRYVYVSPRSVDLMGYTPEEIIGRFSHDFMPPDKVKKIIPQVKKILEAEKPFHRIERTCRHKKGHLVILETSGVPFFDSLGNLAGFRGIDRDITDKKYLEAQALRTRHLAAIGELAAGVAHEINNPINGIINYAQILEDDAEASGGDPDILRRIKKEGDRVAEIVKNLLYFSRQSSGDKKPVPVRPVLADSLALFAAQLRKDGIHVSVDIPDDIPLVMGNRHQLQQVFMNILGNSRHALLAKSNGENRKKQIVIKAGAPESNGVKLVTVSFHDNGIGIAPGLLERIFDPFFTTKAAGEGTGLGLSISYGIIKDHGGSLIVESEPGDYTLATVNLPASTAG